MSALTDVRTAIVAVLTSAGFKSVEYVGETIVPPVAVVVPGNPYIDPEAENVEFGHVAVNTNVLIIGSRGTNKTQASEIDGLVWDAYIALADAGYDLGEVASPGQVQLNGSVFIGAVISVQHTIKLEAPGG